MNSFLSKLSMKKSQKNDKQLVTMTVKVFYTFSLVENIEFRELIKMVILITPFLIENPFLSPLYINN